MCLPYLKLLTKLCHFLDAAFLTLPNKDRFFLGMSMFGVSLDPSVNSGRGIMLVISTVGLAIVVSNPCLNDDLLEAREISISDFSHLELPES